MAFFKTRFVSFFLLLLACAAVAHAGTITGKITDAKGEPLPFATVFVLGTTVGTTANGSGIYTLPVDDGKATLVCQYIGYVQQRKAITVAGTVTVNFSLPEQKGTMQEVVIKANDEDPAYRIIRKTLKKRKAHLRQAATFQTDVYLKGVMRLRDAPNQLFGIKINDEDKGTVDSSLKGVIYMVEEEATVYQKGADQRTIIRAVRENGDANGVGFSQMPPIVSFYENNINLGEMTPRGQVSPIADGALNYYRYKLEGEFREGNATIFKIRVTPKRDFEPLFFGHIYIVDEDFAIHSLSLTATSRQMLEQLDTLRMDQQYIPVGKDQWIVKSQLFYPTIKLLGFSATGNFVTVYSGQRINQPLPDSIFASKAISTYDKTANKKDSTYWTAARPVDLEDDEVKDMRVKDSAARVVVDPARQDSLRRRANRLGLMDVLTGHTWRGRHSATEVNGLLTMTSFNTVEGLVFAPNIEHTRRVDSNDALHIRLAPRYGFGYNRFQAMGRVEWRHRNKEWRGRGWSLGIEGGRYVFQYSPANPVPELANTVSTLLFGRNRLKLYERAGAAISGTIRPAGGLRISGAVHFQDRRPLQNTDFFTWTASEDVAFTPNLPDELRGYPWQPHRAFLYRLSATYRPGSNRYIQYPDYRVNVGSKWPLLNAAIEQGIPGIADSRTDYFKWRAGISHEVRLRLFGELSYNVAVGGFLSKKYVPVADLNHIIGNQFTLSAPYLQSFQLAPFYRYSNAANLYAEAHAEYNLQGLITNKIPLLRQARWFFILGGNALYISDKEWYAEGMLSIDNLGYKLFRVLRVDLVHSWDAQGRTNSGIRLGLRFGGLVDFKGQADGEW